MLQNERPVAGVPLLILQGKNADACRNQLLSALDFSESEFKKKAKALSDSNGEFAMARFSGCAVALAWNGGGFGAVAATSDDGLIKLLHLEADDNLKIRVLEANGTSLSHVEVVFTSGRFLHIAVPRWYQTDSRGLVFVRHAHLAFEESANWIVALSAKDRKKRDVAIRGIGPGSSIKREIPFGKPCPNELDLVLSQVGLVHLVGVDDNGDLHDGSFGLGVSFGTSENRRRDRISVPSGGRVFPVPPGVSFHFSYSQREWIPPTVVEVDSLTAGEKRRVEIPTGKKEARAVYSARVLMPNGMPTRDTDIESFVNIQRDATSLRPEFERSSKLGSTRSTENGVVTFNMLGWYAEACSIEGQKLVSLSVLVAGADGPLVGTMDLPDPWPKGSIDFGDIQVKPLPVTISGTVRDADGRPLAGADVVLNGMFEGMQIDLARVRTRENGRFTFTDSELLPEKMDLVVDAQGFSTESRSGITKGTRSIAVIMRRKSSLILRAPGVAMFGDQHIPFFLVATEKTPTNREVYWRNATWELGLTSPMRETGLTRGDDQIVWDDPDPGHYRIEVRGAGLAEPLLVIKDVVVKASEITIVDFPDGFSIATHIEQLTLDFKAEGLLLENQSVVLFPRIREDSAHRRPWRFLDHSGRIPTAKPVPPMAGLVSQSDDKLVGFFVTKGGKKHETIEIAPAIEVVIIGYDELAKAELETLRFEVSMTACRVPGFDDLPLEGLFDIQGEFGEGNPSAIFLPGAGSYRIDFGSPGEGYSIDVLASLQLEVKNGEKGPVKVKIPKGKKFRAALKRKSKEWE